MIKFLKYSIIKFHFRSKSERRKYDRKTFQKPGRLSGRNLQSGCKKRLRKISNSLNVKKASVTGALNTLSAKKLINYEPYSKITLTKTGEDFARTIHEKHENLREFFENVLGLSKEEASDNACRMEHIVSEKFFTNFVKFSDFIRDYSKQNPDFIRQYKKMIK